ncbi:MAG: FeoB-associated Cys-rich membrane protein [Bacteroidaceae bacterium]|nr:FeoB-associated Cys-rich membrane protein [Prevotellaceae bacterium]MDY5632625.1 FeoB-associated Cys-rich membrane protein [Bacteroidaceae bacterium]
MNTQSILLLAVILAAATLAAIRYWRRPKCGSHGGACQGCSLKEQCTKK